MLRPTGRLGQFLFTGLPQAPELKILEKDGLRRDRGSRHPETFSRSVTLTSPSWLVNERV
jgi:hypothetical protein